MTPSVELLAVTEPVVSYLDNGEQLIEYSGRWDYGPMSIAKMGQPGIIGRWIEAGHESMLEMVDAAFLITCSRVVSHELVRHRIASYQQESQRYVKYDQESPDDLYFVPPEIVEAGADAVAVYRESVHASHSAYRALKQAGVKSQIARYVLPNATRTRIVVKMNLREWRHVLKLRCHSSAQPEMRVVMLQVLEILYARYPEVFESVKREIEQNERGIR